MSAYEPPTQNLAIFDPDVFNQNDEPLTITTGSKYFLKYPNAQGEENLQATNVNGVLTANSSTTLNGAVTIPNNDMFLRGIRIGLGGGNQVRNTMLGVNNGNANTTGNNNTFIGALCGTSNTTGRDNVFLGTFSGIKNTTGFQNTFLGIDAGNFCTTGSRNTHIGRQAGYYNTGDNNICIGDWADASGNISNSMAFGVDVKATASNTIVLGTSSQTTQIAGSVVVGQNSNLTMNAGTGRINQPSVVGDVSTKNTFKFSDFTFNSNVAGGTQNAFEFFDGVNGRGLFILPNSATGSLSDTNISNDCVLSSRSIQNTNAITISNWNTNMRNGLRVFTTDVSNCGLTLQCGQNTGAGYTELAMNYNRTSNTTTTSFNNAINFNPTLPIATNSSRRLLSGLGTLSFTDISGNNSTNGAFNSRIWSDSSLTTGLGTGMFYDCSMGGLCGHTFRVSDGAGNKINVLSVNSTGLTSRESLTFASTAISDRNINNVGTLNFLDLSANTTQGTTISNIYTDSSLVGGIGGMYYQNNINSGYHIFQARDASGVLTAPIYYGSALTSVSNTFVVRNDSVTSNRLDIFGDTSQNTYVRGRTSTFSTNAHIHIQCDFRGASGSVVTNDVLNFTPTAVNYRRPIQFNYLTTPSAINQLGFLVGTQMSSVNVATSTNIRNITTYTFTSAGTYLINWGVYSNMSTGTATFTQFQIGIANSATNTFDTYTQTYPSYKNLIRTYPTLTTTSDLYEPTSCVYVASSGSIAYFNYLANYTGGTNIIIGGYYTITRIG